MRLLSFLLLSLALATALPTDKGKKSLIEDTKLEKKSTLPITEEGKEKERSKKQASFTVEIKPTAYQSDCKEQAILNNQVIPTSQIQTVSVIPRQPAQLQTLNVVPSQQPQVQTLNVVPSQQTLNVAPQAPQSSSIVIPAQPAVQPVHTLHILQSVPQPCAQQAQVSFVQPPPQQTVNIVETPKESKPAPKPKPTPEAAPERIIEVQKPEPHHRKPSQIVNIIQPAPVPEPHETVSILPMEQECDEQMVVLPSPQMYVMAQPEPQLATLVEMPTRPCYHQQQSLYTQCNCGKNLAIVAGNEKSSTGSSFRTLHHLHDHHSHGHGHYGSQYGNQYGQQPTPIYVYSTTIAAPATPSLATLQRPTMTLPARPSMMVQYNPVQSPISVARSSGNEAEALKSPQGRTSTTINLNTGLPGRFHIQNPYGYSSPTSGISINGYPVSGAFGTYRQSGTAQYPGVTVQEGSMNSPGASEAMDMIQAITTKKVPRETDPNILAAQEADENIKAITEVNQDAPRTPRSEEKAKNSN